jgi:hypothetical protein|nr:hypothetical protein [Kofleriaceae bacterium]
MTRFAVLALGLAIGCGAAAAPAAAPPAAPTTPPATAAASPFIGDWKLDVARTTYTDLMTVRGVDDHTFVFAFEGGDDERVVIDGTDQPGAQDTTLAVRTTDPTHWTIIRKQDGHLIITASWTLSADGNHLSDDFTQLAPDGQVTTHARYDYTRTGDGAGFAGTWEAPVGLDHAPLTILQVRPFHGDGLSFIRPSLDVTKNAAFDGNDYPVVGHGAGAGATVSARRLGEHAVELVDKSKGELQRTERFELSPDLHTLTQTLHPVGQRGANVFVYARCATAACT